MPYQLKEINHAIETDVSGFLEECDAGYQVKIAQAADCILGRLKDSPIVLLSGPSGSGKTTTAMKIEESWSAGVHTHTISLDNYFVTMNVQAAPRTPEGGDRLRVPKCLDMELLTGILPSSAGGRDPGARSELACQMRDTSRARPLRLGANEIAIFEGIHASMTI